ncbi:MAG: hypothetical protein KDI17_06040 [Halioglobus sp.]|nr:hypothetical protein [Halioglobus sp.]
MRSPHKALPCFVLLMSGVVGAWAAPGDVVVNVEAMIGEATIVNRQPDGQQEKLVIPTGKTTSKDPGTGQILLAPSSTPNKVNEVVRAIAASSPDSEKQPPSDDGCSQGNAPQRLSPRPEYDEAAASAINKQLESLSSGELMMVMAVLINNAKHLCIDASTVANAVSLISTTRPEEAANAVFVASLLDPDHADNYSDAAAKAAPAQADNIRKATADVKELKKDFGAKITPLQPTPKPTTRSNPPIQPLRDVPPGGAIGKPPSPE